MRKTSGLRWPTEPGAWSARTRVNHYIARPRREGGYALYYGGQHIGNHPDEAACMKAADGYETYRANRKGPDT